MENNLHLYSIFKTRNEIDKLVKEGLEDSPSTVELTELFAQLKKERSPFYITLEELQKVLKWKLRGQEGRKRLFREKNTNENVVLITTAAFGIIHADAEYETELRLKTLTALAGVEVPVASAILTLCFPDKYSVIDFRNWRQVFPNGKNKTLYTFKDYSRYLKQIKRIASEFDVTPQEVDIAIWMLDRKQVMLN